MIDSDNGNKKSQEGCTKNIVVYIGCTLLLCLSVAVLIAFIVVYMQKVYLDNYAVVIDAGSTGSRAYLYKWKDSSNDANDVVTEVTNCKAAKLQNLNWTDPNNGLILCISNIVTDIPSNFLYRPYIYVASTAGMRLYEKQYPKETEIMFKNIENNFQKKYYRTKYVGIISGKVEGISAWITANVLEKKIGKGLPKHETIGTLDLGGSSTQIAYETSSSKEIIHLFSHSYPIYAKSYLCYGSEMFNLKYKTYVASKSEETSYSCLLRNSPVRLKEDIKVCRYQGSENLNFENVSKEVKPNQANCKRQISNIVNGDMKFIKAPSNTKFMAMSSYYYYYTFLQTHYKAISNIDEFEKFTMQFCAEDYNDLSQKFSREMNYAIDYCIQGMYILELLRGFGVTNFSNIEFIDKIGGNNVGWNLGYMIDMTRSIPDLYVRKLNKSFFILIIVISSIIFVSSIILLLYLILKRNHEVYSVSA